MAICQTDYCADPLGIHTENDCGDIMGGLPALILFQCKPENPSDGAAVQDMIDAGTAWKWSGILAGIPEASPVEIDAKRSCGESTVARVDRTLDIVDANISRENIQFFNRAKRKSFAHAIAYNCASGETLNIIPASVIKVRGTVVWPNQNNDTASFTGQLYWNNIDDPELIDTPDGIFDGE